MTKLQVPTSYWFWVIYHQCAFIILSDPECMHDETNVSRFHILVLKNLCAHEAAQGYLLYFISDYGAIEIGKTLFQ